MNDTNTNIPIPDPTTLTTDALLREIGHLKELVTLRLDLEERNRVEQKADMKAALESTLTSSEKAIAKSELAISGRLADLSKRADDLKDQVLRGEARKEGGDQKTAAIYAFVGFLAAIVVLGGVVLAIR